MAGLFKKILSRFSREKVDWDELEESLVGGDLGVKMSMQIIDRLQEMGRKLKPEEVIDVCREEIRAILPADSPALTPLGDRPKVILVVGVNGTGKTTSTAKLAKLLKDSGHSVMLAAADTFRAAAIEQLDIWAQRLDVPIIKGQYKADPSSVCFDAHAAATKAGVDFLLCDTAGRLHTRHNLMEELKKISRTIAKRDDTAPHEALLVVDATTGSNALSQAKQFQAATDLTGMIVTKLDGSGKGGVVVSIAQELGVPTRFIGLGERAEDFERFEAERFVGQIL
jgi:fused signal recognition particle receptor